ncbi:hypothetical protein PHYBOEH_001794 [Phytophthora boehmeriae]|uniref:FYVE-type domain-containing protein n=1 Tax=Phytophthora boehmeriae TaxID=109152 RepID=A0A8T1WTH4_9STRA|nr:hypothetical protein PHYBOEH_001794 [Phytophthora boehmeriae]
MPFFARKTEAEKAQAQRLKELDRAAKAQRKQAAKAQKVREQQQKRLERNVKRQEKQFEAQRRAELKRLNQAAKKEVKEQRAAQKQAEKAHKKTVKLALKATKARKKAVRKTEKERKRRLKRRARLQPDGPVPPFKNNSSCYVCGKHFQKQLHRRRHHCRQCRESCCLQCVSRTRHAVPVYGLHKPQKICVVCDCLVFNNETTADAQVRDPAEAIAGLVAARPTASRRPSSAPLPPTTVNLLTSRGRARSAKASLWTLPIRPLLKRKRSAEQLRNRKMDLDLQLEKEAMRCGRAIELQPQQSLAAMAS